MEPRVLAHAVEGNGDPVVLLPGGVTGWLSWIPHAERLSARWRAIRIQPIHNELGSAGVPGDAGYTAATDRESLRLTLDALEIDTAHFAGWSAGGGALMEFALTQPERVRTLTFVEPQTNWIHGPDPEVERSNALIERLFGREISEDDLAEFLTVAGFAGSTEEARSDPYWERALPHRAALSWLAGLLRSTRTIDELATVQCPVLLVKGSLSDDLDRRTVDLLGERLPNATVIELEGDHASHIQSLDEFLDAFERHLTSAR